MVRLKEQIAVSDSGFLLNPSTGESFSLNPMGVEILNMIRQGKTREEIESLLLEHYDVSASTVEKDLQDFEGVLRQFHLLETENSDDEA